MSLTEDDRDALRDWWDEDETVSVESSFPIIARIVARERSAALTAVADELDELLQLFLTTATNNPPLWDRAQARIVSHIQRLLRARSTEK